MASNLNNNQSDNLFEKYSSKENLEKIKRLQFWFRQYTTGEKLLPLNMKSISKKGAEAIVNGENNPSDVTLAELLRDAGQVYRSANTTEITQFIDNISKGNWQAILLSADGSKSPALLESVALAALRREAITMTQFATIVLYINLYVGFSNVEVVELLDEDNQWIASARDTYLKAFSKSYFEMERKAWTEETMHRIQEKLKELPKSERVFFRMRCPAHSLSATLTKEAVNTLIYEEDIGRYITPSYGFLAIIEDVLYGHDAIEMVFRAANTSIAEVIEKKTNDKMIGSVMLMNQRTTKKQSFWNEVKVHATPMTPNNRWWGMLHDRAHAALMNGTPRETRRAIWDLAQLIRAESGVNMSKEIWEIYDIASVDSSKAIQHDNQRVFFIYLKKYLSSAFSVVGKKCCFNILILILLIRNRKFFQQNHQIDVTQFGTCLKDEKLKSYFAFITKHRDGFVDKSDINLAILVTALYAEKSPTAENIACLLEYLREGIDKNVLCIGFGRIPGTNRLELKINGETALTSLAQLYIKFFPENKKSTDKFVFQPSAVDVERMQRASQLKPMDSVLTDEQGNTIFHYFAAGKINIKESILEYWFHERNSPQKFSELKKALLQKNKEGVNWLELAVKMNSREIFNKLDTIIGCILGYFGQVRLLFSNEILPMVFDELIIQFNDGAFILAMCDKLQPYSNKISHNLKEFMLEQCLRKGYLKCAAYLLCNNIKLSEMAIEEIRNTNDPAMQAFNKTMSIFTCKEDFVASDVKQNVKSVSATC